MNKLIVLIFASLLIYGNDISQNKFTCLVKDSATQEILPGVSVVLNKTTNGAITDLKGRATLLNIPDGAHTIVFTFTGYKTISKAFTFPVQEEITVLLPTENGDLEEVVISSTRTNSRIEDLNTK